MKRTLVALLGLVGVVLFGCLAAIASSGGPATGQTYEASAASPPHPATLFHPPSPAAPDLFAQARPAAPIGTNLALRKPATQSSTGYGGDPGRAVDGNTDGSYSGGNSVSHTNNQPQEWWQVDLGAVHPIQVIRIWNRTDCCAERLSRFHVFVSPTPLPAGGVQAAQQHPGVWTYYFDRTAGRTTEIPVSRSGRYVRIQLAGADYLQLAEVEVLGGGAVGGQPPAPPGGPVTGRVNLVTVTSAQDYVGANEALQRSGRNDVQFRLAVSAAGRTLTGLELRNTDGQYSVWDTLPGNGMWLMAVTQGGRLLNDAQGRLVPTPLPPSGEATLDLYVEDNGSVAGGQTHYQLTLLFQDGSRQVLPVNLAAVGPSPQPPTPPGGPVTGRVNLVTVTSAQDYVGANEALQRSGRNDVQFRLAVSAAGRTLTGLELRNTDGQYSVWDTLPGNGMWLMAVTQGGRLLNDAQGRLVPTPLPPSGEATLDLYVEDNGSVAGGQTHYQLTLLFQDGSRQVLPVNLAAVGPSPQPPGGRDYTSIPIQPVPPSSSACAQETRVYTNGNIAAVQNQPTQPTRFALTHSTLVTYVMTYHWNNARGQAPGTIGLRHQDGTLYGPWQATSAPGQGGVPNAYWIARPNVLLKPGTYTFVDSDAATWAQNAQSQGQGMVEVKGCGGVAEQPPAPPGGPVTGRVNLVTVTSAQDYVGANEALQRSGRNDVQFRLAVSAAGRTLTGLELRNTDGQYSVWDTLPGNGMWLMAVTQGGRLLNDAQGRLVPTPLPPSGEATLDLYVEDNGSVAGGQTHYQLTLLFQDGSRQVLPVNLAAVGPSTPTSGGITWDFETGDLRGWTKTGTAFDFQPTYGDNPTGRQRGQPSQHQGQYWIGGYEKRPRPSDPAGQVQGDEPQGTLTSAPFAISRPSIGFLLGGGCDINTERVELLVDGQVVLRATGKCTETMERVRWDVSRHVGRTGQLRLVDTSGGGWGHINFDDVRFE